MLEQRDGHTIQLVLGSFYVETSREVHFQTPYARVWCEEDCKGIFNRESTLLEVKSLEGRWLIKRTGEAQTYALPAGLQVAIGEVTTDGQAQMDFPQSLPWLPTVKQWAALFPGSVDELKPTLVKFRDSWKEAVEAVSDLHQHAASRAIASYEKTQAQERARLLAIQREDQKLRDLFREKNP